MNPATAYTADVSKHLRKKIEQSNVKERIDDHIKWYGAKAGQSDHIWPVRLQLTYITFQQALNAGHEWLICYGQM